MARKPTRTKSGPADAPAVLPKTLVSGIRTIDPSSGRGKDVPIQDSAASYVNTSVQSLRSESNPNLQIRALRHFSGDVNTAIAATVRIANTQLRFRVYDSTHQLSDDGSLLLKSLLKRFELQPDYTTGFDDRQALDAVAATCLQEMLLSGGVGMELVLDKVRIPYQLKPVSPTQLKWKIGKQATGKDSAKVIPWQQAQGVTTELDIPTFFWAELDKDPTIVYPRTPLETAVNTAIYQAETLEDIRRVVKRSGHSRLTLRLITEELLKAAPPDVRTDPEKLAKWMEDQRARVQADVENLSPEAALILFDVIEADYLNSEVGASADYTPLTEIVDSMVATSLRTPTSVLGKRLSAGSQNVASTESLLFMKMAAGIQQPVSQILTRALTLAVRLMGFDGYVEAQFAPIDLRPETELAAFHTMNQARILELLSLGFYTDQEAAELLGTGPRAPGAPPLSGTMFYTAKQGGSDPSANGDPARRALSGNDTPKKAGGSSQ